MTMMSPKITYFTSGLISLLPKLRARKIFKENHPLWPSSDESLAAGCTNQKEDGSIRHDGPPRSSNVPYFPLSWALCTRWMRGETFGVPARETRSSGARDSWVPARETLSSSARDAEFQRERLSVPARETLSSSARDAEFQRERLSVLARETLSSSARDAEFQRERLSVPARETLSSSARDAKFQRERLSVPERETLSSSARDAKFQCEGVT